MKEQIAEAYYLAMNEKNLDKVSKFLSPDVRLISPLAGEAKGSYLEAISRFMASFKALKIRAKCGSGNQAMLAIDVEYPEPVGILKAAALVTFNGDLIASVELFHDTKPFR